MYYYNFMHNQNILVLKEQILLICFMTTRKKKNINIGYKCFKKVNIKRKI